MEPKSALIFDDIDIGAVFRTDSYSVTIENIKEFASLYDPQYLHLDERAALDGPFGKFTASGWQTLSVTMRLMALRKPFGETPLVGVSVKSIRFFIPVLPGYELTANATVTDKRLSSKPKRGYVNMTVETFDKVSSAKVLEQKWMVMVPA